MWNPKIEVSIRPDSAFDKVQHVQVRISLNLNFGICKMSCVEIQGIWLSETTSSLKILGIYNSIKKVL